MRERFNAGDWNVLANHVSGQPIAGGYVSTFNAAAREARVLTGRNPQTGQPDPDAGSTTVWAGTVVYLILLEQIGKSLRPKGARGKLQGESAIEKAVRQFAPGRTMKRERQVIYALRNAFAHEFGLFNDGNGLPRYRVAFMLDNQPAPHMIKWPRSAGAVTIAKSAAACRPT
jgi:hypothetical protein